ncbi:Gfo/Idh/MocA family oxidoreductase [Fulvivirga maritima]|uniref:Gfo/Idh/MocA family protein n=1 Tax=Fulvivirga maritima TaxID=2904247 RepID=UPI001F19CAA9|nr:Gfo/Idh/MocA family oxidoreductase [Fulvivirga maritima]UII26711.1 Gfo/Idh/MocA family oxidoreductase [Fulvivirga maritima]
MIKWGIIGTGTIVHRFLNDFPFAEGGQLAAIASRNIERANEVATAYKIPKAYGSYEALLQDPQVDAIYIGTPHHLHYENTIACLEAGKAVLCEKPISVNTDMVKGMFAKAEEKRTFLMEAMWTYFLPPVLVAQQWVNEGQIGKLKMIKADFGFTGNFSPDHRLFNPNMAGGALLDVGIYPIALALLFAQSTPKDIMANAIIGETGVDETNSIEIKFENGVIAQLTSSVTDKFPNKGYIYGTEGYIEIPNFWEAKTAKLHRYDEEGSEEFVDARKPMGFNYEIEEVNQCLMDGKLSSSTMGLKQSMDLIGVMDQVRSIIGLKYPFE